MWLATEVNTYFYLSVDRFFKSLKTACGLSTKYIHLHAKGYKGRSLSEQNRLTWKLGSAAQGVRR